MFASAIANIFIAATKKLIPTHVFVSIVKLTSTTRLPHELVARTDLSRLRRRKAQDLASDVVVGSSGVKTLSAAKELEAVSKEEVDKKRSAKLSVNIAVQTAPPSSVAVTEAVQDPPDQVDEAYSITINNVSSSHFTQTAESSPRDEMAASASSVAIDKAPSPTYLKSTSAGVADHLSRPEGGRFAMFACRLQTIIHPTIDNGPLAGFSFTFGNEAFGEDYPIRMDESQIVELKSPIIPDPVDQLADSFRTLSLSAFDDFTSHFTNSVNSWTRNSLHASRLPSRFAIPAVHRSYHSHTFPIFNPHRLTPFASFQLSAPSPAISPLAHPSQAFGARSVFAALPSVFPFSSLADTSPCMVVDSQADTSLSTSSSPATFAAGTIYECSMEAADEMLPPPFYTALFSVSPSEPLPSLTPSFFAISSEPHEPVASSSGSQKKDKGMGKMVEVDEPVKENKPRTAQKEIKHFTSVASLVGISDVKKHTTKPSPLSQSSTPPIASTSKAVKVKKMQMPTQKKDEPRKLIAGGKRVERARVLDTTREQPVFFESQEVEVWDKMEGRYGKKQGTTEEVD